MKQGRQLLLRLARIATIVFLLLTGSLIFLNTTASRPTAEAAAGSPLAQKPLLGWSSWSTIRSHPSAANIEAQAQAMAGTLKSHGYSYINVDDFWYLNPTTTVDSYGRWAIDTSKFPNGISSVATYVHNLGLKFGLYLTPGIPVAAVNQNTPIEGTSYHAKDIADTSKHEKNYNFGGGAMYYIDYSKPGAQAYINSWANELASWGVDFLKMDGVGDPDVGDIQAWSQGLQQSGRPIYFHLSNSLDVNNASTWRQYANGWRISGDVECYCSTLVTWGSVAGRFGSAQQWAQWAGPGGWNDLDSLDVGNGSKDGLTNDERQTYMTFWAMAAAPLYTGDDLTTLDSYGVSLLTNNAVIAVDQAGITSTPVSTATNQQVWRSYQPDGSYYVALYNLATSSASVTANWSDLGIAGSASVSDLWSGQALGSFSTGFSATLNSHASRLLKIVPANPRTAASYEAEASGNTLSGGAVLQNCPSCSGGKKVGFIGNGGTLSINNVNASTGGYYSLTIHYVDGDAGRTGYLGINSVAGSALFFANTGSWSQGPGSITLTVKLNAGSNTIKFYNSSAYAPDIDRITLNT